MARTLPPHLRLWELTASMILVAELSPPERRVWRKFSSAVGRHSGINVTRRSWRANSKYLDYPMPYPEWTSHALDDHSWNLETAELAAQDFARRVGIVGGVAGMVDYWRSWRKMQGWHVGEDLIDPYGEI